MRRVARKLGLGLGSDVRERGDVDEGGNDRHALFDEPGQVPRQKARGVLDAVDAGVQHVVEGVFGEAVRRDPGALIVGGPDGVPSTAAGNDGARSPASRSIQSPTSLTQPSPSRACLRTASTRPSGSTSTAKFRR